MKNDLAASLEATIVDILMDKLRKSSQSAQDKRNSCSRRSISQQRFA